MENLNVKFTFSAGICASDKSSKVDEMLKFVDAALYTAKKEGRNKCIIYNHAQAE